MNTVAVIWRSFLVLIFGASLLFGAAVLGNQVFTWAKTGEWIAVPFAQAFTFYNVDLSSVYYPQDWKGLAGAAAWVLGLPLFVVAPVVGFVACVLLRKLDPFGVEEWRLYGNSQPR